MLAIDILASKNFLFNIFSNIITFLITHIETIAINELR